MHSCNSVKVWQCHQKSFFLLAGTEALIEAAEWIGEESEKTVLCQECVRRLIENPTDSLWNTLKPRLYKLIPDEVWKIEYYLNKPDARRNCLLHSGSSGLLSDVSKYYQWHHDYENNFQHCPLVLCPKPIKESYVLRNAIVLNVYLAQSDPRNPELILCDRVFKQQLARAKQLAISSGGFSGCDSLKLYTPWQLDGLQLKDSSAGLPLAVAAVLSSFHQSLSRPVVFSGALNENGGLQPVDKIEEKYHAALEEGYVLIACTEKDVLKNHSNFTSIAQTRDWEETWQEVLNALNRLEIEIVPCWPKWIRRLNELKALVAKFKPFEAKSSFEEIKRVAERVLPPDNPRRNIFFIELEGLEGRLLIHSGRQAEGVSRINKMIEKLEMYGITDYQPSMVQNEAYAQIPALIDLLVDPDVHNGWVVPLLTFQQSLLQYEISRLGVLSLWYYLRALWTEFDESNANKSALLWNSCLATIERKYSIEKWYIENNLEPSLKIDLNRTRNDRANMLFMVGKYDEALTLYSTLPDDLYSWVYYLRFRSWKAWKENDKKDAYTCIQMIHDEAMPWLPWPDTPLNVKNWLSVDHWHLAANLCRSMMISYFVVGDCDSGKNVARHVFAGLAVDGKDRMSMPAITFRQWSIIALSYYLWHGEEERKLIDEKFESIPQELIRRYYGIWNPGSVEIKDINRKIESVTKLFKVCYY